MLLQQKEGTISMPQTIEYEEKHFIIINDIENSLFYFFDFDVRSTERTWNLSIFIPTMKFISC